MRVGEPLKDLFGFGRRIDNWPSPPFRFFGVSDVTACAPE